MPDGHNGVSHRWRVGQQALFDDRGARCSGLRFVYALGEFFTRCARSSVAGRVARCRVLAGCSVSPGVRGSRSRLLWVTFLQATGRCCVRYGAPPRGVAGSRCRGPLRRPGGSGGRPARLARWGLPAGSATGASAFWLRLGSPAGPVFLARGLSCSRRPGQGRCASLRDRPGAGPGLGRREQGRAAMRKTGRV